MKHEDVERLLARYFDAAASEAEERALREYFVGTERLPEQWRSLRVLFCGEEELARERMPLRRATLPAAGPAWRRQLPGRWLWGLTAAAVLAVGLIAGAMAVRRPYCYIDGVAVYDPEAAMQATVWFDGLARLETSTQVVDRLFAEH